MLQEVNLPFDNTSNLEEVVESMMLRARERLPPLLAANRTTPSAKVGAGFPDPKRVSPARDGIDACGQLVVEIVLLNGSREMAS